MSCERPAAGWYCTRAAGHDGPCAAWPVDPEKTHGMPHARPVRQPPPLPVARPVARPAAPLGGTLAPLGRVHVPDPAAFTDDEPPTSPRATAHVVNRLIRNYLACTPEDQRLIEGIAIRLRPGISG